MFYHPEAKINRPIDRQINQDNSETTAFSNHNANTIDEWQSKGDIKTRLIELQGFLKNEKNPFQLDCLKMTFTD
jgi:hypothetical protein